MNHVDPKKEKIFTQNFVFLSVAFLMAKVSMTSLLFILPLFLQDIGGDESSAGIATGIFTFFTVIFRPFVGKYIDQLGRKRFLILGIAVFTLTSFVYIWMDNLYLVYLLRGIQGISCGTFVISALTMATDLAPESRRGEALGYFSIVPPTGMALGPAVGSYFMNEFNVETAFLVTGIFLLIAFILSVKVEQPLFISSESAFSFFSTSVIHPSLILLLIGINVGAVMTFIPLLGQARGIVNIGFFFTVYSVIIISTRPLIGRIIDYCGHRVILILSIVSILLSMLIIE